VKHPVQLFHGTSLWKGNCRLTLASLHDNRTSALTMWKQFSPACSFSTVILLNYRIWMNSFLQRRHPIHTWPKLSTCCKISIWFLAFPHRPFRCVTLTSCGVRTYKNAMFPGVLGLNEEEIQREDNAKYVIGSITLSHFSGRVLWNENINYYPYTLKGSGKLRLADILVVKVFRQMSVVGRKEPN
jgi:hypothetical protein